MMYTEVISIRLPLHEAAVIRRQAADKGLTKSAHAANLVSRGLEAQDSERLQVQLGELQQALDRLHKLAEQQSVSRPGNGPAASTGAKLDPRQHAFMIEVLVLLRYLTKNDLRLGGEIGRKLQKAVGDVRVDGT